MPVLSGLFLNAVHCRPWLPASQTLQSLSSGLFLFLENSNTFEWFASLFFKHSCPFRVVGAPCFSNTPVLTERLLTTVTQIFPSFSSSSCLCFSHALVPFERFPPRFLNTLVPFERFALCSSNTLVLLERFVLCFANTLTSFERYASTSVPFGRSALCFCNILLCEEAVCSPILKYCTPF